MVQATLAQISTYIHTGTYLWCGSYASRLQGSATWRLQYRLQFWPTSALMWLLHLINQFTLTVLLLILVVWSFGTLKCSSPALSRLVAKLAVDRILPIDSQHSTSWWWAV